MYIIYLVYVTVYLVYLVYVTVIHMNINILYAFNNILIHIQLICYCYTKIIICQYINWIV